jgi:hypothetical protein
MQVLKALSAIVVFTGACASGAGQMGPPTPLKYLLEDRYIERVPPEGRNKEFDAQREVSVANAERGNAEAKLEEWNTEFDVATNDAKAAALEEQSARSMHKAAVDSADMTRKAQTEKELNAAELGKKSADLKVVYLKAHKEHLKKHYLWAQHNASAKQAKYELEKARVAKANNIQPPQFVFDLYEKQYQERSENAQKAKVFADDEKVKAEEKKAAWKSAEKEWFAAKGMKAPEEIKPTPDKAPPPPGTDTTKPPEVVK